MPLFARRLAEERPDEIALRDPLVAMRWADVDDALDRVANGLALIDLGPAKRVSVFAENAAQTALAHLGALLGGASTVPVNFHLTADEAAYILEDSRTKVLFVGPETVERGVVAAAQAGVETVIGSLGAPPRRMPGKVCTKPQSKYNVGRHRDHHESRRKLNPEKRRVGRRQ